MGLSREPESPLVVTSAGGSLSIAIISAAAQSADAARQELGAAPDLAAVERFRLLVRRVCGLALLVRPAMTASHYAGIREEIDAIESAARRLRRPAADLAALAAVREPADRPEELDALEAAMRSAMPAASGGAAAAELMRRLDAAAGALERALPNEVPWSTDAEGLAETYRRAAGARGAVGRAPDAERARAWARHLGVLGAELALLAPRSAEEIGSAREQAEQAADLLEFAALAGSLPQPARLARRCGRRAARGAGRRVALALERTESTFNHTADCFVGALGAL